MRSMVLSCRCRKSRSERLRAPAIVLAALCAGSVAAEEPWVTATGQGLVAARYEAPDDSYPHRIAADPAGFKEAMACR